MRLSNSTDRTVWLFGTALFMALLSTLIVYWPGLSGPLLLDDVVNLQALGNADGIKDIASLLQFVFANDSGPLGRPVAMLSFLVDAQDWPPKVAALKYTNLMLHLLCGLAVSWFVWILMLSLKLRQQQAAGFALVVTTLWLLHPMNVSTVLYVIQRMTQLMTLFALLSLVLYCKGRVGITQDVVSGLVYLFLAVVPFALLAVLSKENGVLVLLLIVVLEHTIFGCYARNKWYRAWYGLAVLLPLLLAAIYFGYSVLANLDEFASRQFDPLQRLFTEFRVLVIYLAAILLPFLGMFGPGRFGLFHDDLPISSSLFSPFTTLLCLVMIVALLWAAFAYRRRQPFLALGVFWFFGMHLLESTLLPLELYFEHRNYAAMLGPIIALVWYVQMALNALKAELRNLAIGVASVAVALLFALLTIQQTLIWGSTESLFVHWETEHPGSMRAHVSAADFHIANGDADLAMSSLLAAHSLRPDELSVMLYLWNLSCETGRAPLVPIAQINARQSLENYSGNLNIHLRRMLELLMTQKCATPGVEALENLFYRAIDLPQSALRRSNLHVLFSEFYVWQGNLDGALIQLRRAFDIRPLAEFPLRQALLAASAGNYADSLVFLDRARQADRERPFLQPSRLPEIDRIYSDVVRLSQTNNPAQ